MRKQRRKLQRRLKSWTWRLLFAAILIAISAGCFQHSVQIDVLRPPPAATIYGFTTAGTIVQLDAQGTTTEVGAGNIVVSPDYILWVEDLKAAIRKLAAKSEDKE